MVSVLVCLSVFENIQPASQSIRPSIRQLIFLSKSGCNPFIESLKSCHCCKPGIRLKQYFWNEWWRNSSNAILWFWDIVYAFSFAYYLPMQNCIEFIVNNFAIDTVCSTSNASKHIVDLFAQWKTVGLFKFSSGSYLLFEQEMSPEEGTF